MLQKKILSTPTTRFASFNEIFDFFKPKTYKNLKKKHPYKKNKKLFSSQPLQTITGFFKTNFVASIEHIIYNKKPYQTLLQLRSIYNHTLFIPGIEYLLPGQKIFDLTKNLVFTKICYTGSQIYLSDLPYNLFASCLSNNLNNK
jgi:hypothetical protein